MPANLFAIQIVIFLLAFWLGTFLLGREPSRAALRNPGLGLLVYAVALAGLLLGDVAPNGGAADRFIRWAYPLIFMPSILWAGTLVHLLPQDVPYRETFVLVWRYALPVLVLGFYALGAGTEWIFATDGGVRGIGYLVAGLIALLPLMEALILTTMGFLRIGPQRPLGLLLAALLFFTLGTTLLVVPVDWLPRSFLLVGIGIDLLLLGLAVASLDAFNEGEAWLPELLRALVGTGAALLLFAGPVALTMRLSTGLTLPMVLLLLSIASAAVLTQTFGPRWQALLDNLAYASFPRLRQAQAHLRGEAQAHLRLGDGLDPATLDPDEFTRLTRRALSHFGNLPKLALSPLTQLTLIEQRIQERGLRGDTLERAAELKQLLVESIERLRPPGGGDGFHSTDEWRHFNVLYYPYAAGLRPYSRRAPHDKLPPAAAEALDWFRRNVPERTLYNWQAAAAELVAQDLRERASGPGE